MAYGILRAILYLPRSAFCAGELIDADQAVYGVDSGRFRALVCNGQHFSHSQSDVKLHTP